MCICIFDFVPEITIVVLQILFCAPYILKTPCTNLR
jgi:hypothetical protein